MKLISIVTPCYNEEGNIKNIYGEVRSIFENLPEYRYEHIFIDNSSKDGTITLLKELASKDKNVKVIINSRNFGPLRSPHYGLLQAFGDAVVLLVADLQDPPSLIPEFIKKWEEGYKIVIGVKSKSKENPIKFALRNLYYNTINSLSEIELVKNYTGFGLYDKKVMDIIREIDDPYPYFRGLICEIGFERYEIEFVQEKRKKGKTGLNLYSLYDWAMLGITSHSKIPLRMATIFGFIMSLLSMTAGFTYFIYKLIHWNSVQSVIFPLITGLFLFTSVQLFFTGILGEYIGTIHTQILKRPLVIEKERINFD